MKENSPILNSTALVRAGGTVVEIRELPWPDYLALVRRIGASISAFFDSKGRVDRKRVLAELARTEDLLVITISKSTGKDDAWIAGLSLADMLAIVGAIVDLNFSPQPAEPSGRNRMRGPNSDESIAQVCDHLVSAGYAIADIQKMTLRQLRLCMRTVTERIRNENNAIRAASQRGGRRR